MAVGTVTWDRPAMLQLLQLTAGVVLVVFGGSTSRRRSGLSDEQRWTRFLLFPAGVVLIIWWSVPTHQ